MFTVLLMPDMQYLETYDKFGADLEGIVSALSFHDIGMSLPMGRWSNTVSLPFLPRLSPVSHLILRVRNTQQNRGLQVAHRIWQELV
jgi:hypothetical protein